MRSSAAHAGSVDAAADAIELGRTAASQVQLAGGAYGQLCAFLPALLEVVGDLAVAALGDAVSSLHESASNVRTSTLT